jgi:hypothetical protein
VTSFSGFNGGTVRSSTTLDRGILRTPARQSESIFERYAHRFFHLRIHCALIPTRAPKPPAGRDWVHEIKHDGYRLQVRRVGDRVRLFTRRNRHLVGIAAGAKMRQSIASSLSAS